MRRTLVLLTVAVAVVFSAVPAAAHARLVGSDPEDGASLDETPAEVVLEFSEPVQQDFAQVAVLDADEGHHESGEPVVAGSTVTQAVAALPGGEYRISYRVGSSDGHPVTGTLAFTVAAADGSGADPTAPPEQTQSRPTAPPTRTQPPEETDSPERAEQPADTETPVAGTGQSGSSPARWLGAAAAIAAAAALVFALLRRPGGSAAEPESDTGPQ